LADINAFLISFKCTTSRQHKFFSFRWP